MHDQFHIKPVWINCLLWWLLIWAQFLVLCGEFFHFLVMADPYPHQSDGAQTTIALFPSLTIWSPDWTQVLAHSPVVRPKLQRWHLKSGPSSPPGNGRVFIARGSQVSCSICCCKLLNFLHQGVLYHATLLLLHHAAHSSVVRPELQWHLKSGPKNPLTNWRTTFESEIFPKIWNFCDSENL